jgi:hypothetical protein
VRPFTTIAVFVLAIVAFAHLLRAIAGWEIVIGGVVLPMWPSLLAFLFAGGLAVGLWREASGAQ